jgi:hypothetical protein
LRTILENWSKVHVQLVRLQRHTPLEKTYFELFEMRICLALLICLVWWGWELRFRNSERDTCYLSIFDKRKLRL